MKTTISCILICMFSVKTLCAEAIIDNYNKHKDSIDEIMNSKNQPHGNIIPISTCSGSLENYDPKGIEPQIQTKGEKMLGSNEHNERWNVEPEIDNSKEETISRWAKMLLDKIYREKKQINPKTDSVFQEKIRQETKYTSSERRTRADPHSSNSYHDNIMGHYSNTGSNSAELHSHSDHEKIASSHSNTASNRAEPHYPNNYHEKTASSHSNTASKRAEPHYPNNYHEQITSFQKESQQAGPHIHNYSYHKKVPNPCSNVEGRRAEVEKENKQESLGVSIAQNSTIDVSDYGYQENIATKESDDEDESDSLVDFPYSVSIQRKGAHYASGALVGERWVLSTAEEFYNVRETIRLFTLRLGSVDCKKGGVVTPIKVIIIHPHFSPGQPSFDISVMRVAKHVPLSSVVKPIGLSRIAGKVMSAKFLTTYWPRIVVKQRVIPLSAKERVKYSSMRVSTQKLIPSDQCNKQMATVNVTLDKNTLCLKPVKIHHSKCKPDPGAPVVAVDGLWGITSGWVSPLCPHQPLPTVFTRVSTSELRVWIDSQMRL